MRHERRQNGPRMLSDGREQYYDGTVCGAFTRDRCHCGGS